VIVLVHAGVADAGMWEGWHPAKQPARPAAHDALPLPGATPHELRGFGHTPMPEKGEFSHAADLAGALDGRPAALVGASFGAQVCLELAARHPELVTRLVLLDAPLPHHDWSDEVRAFADEEDRLLEEGDLDAATDLNVRFWAPTLADVIGPMQRRSFELQVASAAEERSPEAIDLGAVRAPTMVVVGELDHADFHEIADRLAREIPEAEPAVIARAGHLPSLERREQTARLVREFLER
jgi:pimeloyl-ACP methyl ester carboxylesterase